MVATENRKRESRLAWLVECVEHVDRPYLVTGPQAAYEYHRWLTPMENLVSLQVYAEDVSAWHWIDDLDVGDHTCQVFDHPPTSAEVLEVQSLETVSGAIILQPTLEPARYRRRHVIGGLALVAPEDLCLDLLERARGETSVSEAAAIIIAQRDALAWDTLLNQAERRGLARRLGVLLDVINTETEAEVIPLRIIEELGRRVDAMHDTQEIERYAVGRHRSSPSSYQPIGDRWGMEVFLPRYVVGKVAFDLQPQRR